MGKQYFSTGILQRVRQISLEKLNRFLADISDNCNQKGGFNRVRGLLNELPVSQERVQNPAFELKLFCNKVSSKLILSGAHMMQA